MNAKWRVCPASSAAETGAGSPSKNISTQDFFLLGIFDDASHCGEILCTLKTAKKKSLFHPFLLLSAANTVAIDQVVPVCIMVAPV